MFLKRLRLFFSGQKHTNAHPAVPDHALQDIVTACSDKAWKRLAGQDRVTDLRTLWNCEAANCQSWMAELTRAADHARDGNDTVEAARIYSAAAALAPWRLDLRLQLGNMLKDSGRLAEAEETYRAILAEAPEEADPHLQLGHVYKLQGRRIRALACYRDALRLDRSCESARRELFLAGESDIQIEAMSDPRLYPAREQSLHIAATLEDMRRSLADIAAAVPDISAFSTFPIGDYPTFSRLFHIPSPPVQAVPGIVVIVDQTDIPDAVAAAQMAVLSDVKTLSALYIVGARPELRNEWGGRISPEVPITHSEQIRDLPDTLEHGPVLMIGNARIPAPGLADWICCAIGQTGCEVAFCDEEILCPAASPGRPFEAMALRPRPGPDALWLQQTDTVGDVIAFRSDLWSRYRGKKPAVIVSEALAAGRSVGHIPYALARTFRPPEEPERHEPHKLPAEFVIDDTPEECTVIICTRDNAADCCRMVDSLFALARHPDRVHCRVVDNNTSRPADLALLDQMEARHPNSVIVRNSMPFNWSRMNNDATAGITTPNILFCNDDMEMLSPDWDMVLAGLLRVTSTGAVGARLLYPDGTMQHAGVLLGWQGSVIHDGLYEPRDSNAHFGRWQCTRQTSAVTGAFLGIRTKVFAGSGGFDAENMPVGYSDIDLCLRLAATGLRILWTPLIEARHDESVSRGLDHLNPLRHCLRTNERVAFEHKWGTEKLRMDITMNPVWVDATLPFRLIRPVPPHIALKRFQQSLTPSPGFRSPGETSLSADGDPVSRAMNFS